MTMQLLACDTSSLKEIKKILEIFKVLFSTKNILKF